MLWVLPTKKSRLLTPPEKNIHIAFGQPSLAWSPDGMEIAFAGKKYPLIVMIHAGPEVTADWSFDINRFGNFQSNPNVLQYLASRGYAVLIPNFRGSGGYGEKFRRALFQKFASATRDGD